MRVIGIWVQKIKQFFCGMSGHKYNGENLWWRRRIAASEGVDMTDKDIITRWEKVVALCQAEIERLQKAIKVQDIMIEQQDYKLKTAKAEAIKEFADKLTDRICDKSDESLANPDGSNYFIPDVLDDINNIKKEMVGDVE